MSAFEKKQWQLAEQLSIDFGTSQLLVDRSRFIDQLIAKLWLQFKFNNNLAILAVGGYGRGELFPYSDIDLLIIAEQHSDEQAIRQFIQNLWDLKLKVASSVRPLEDCFQAYLQDTSIQTSYLESRFLCGDWETYTRFCSQLQAIKIPAMQFYQSKKKEQLQRHAGYKHTIYSLEPNIKNSPGGLRDAHTIGWVAKYCLKLNHLDELTDRQILTKGDYKKFRKAVNTLSNIRFRLHTLRGKDDNRLLFEQQRIIAEQFGFKSRSGEHAVERFMRRYYRSTAEIQRINALIMQSAYEHLVAPQQQAIQVINTRLQMRLGMLEVRSNDTFKKYPFCLLEIFYLMQKHPELRNPSARTLRLIGDNLYLIDDNFRQDIRAQSLFMEMFRQAQGISWVLDVMHRYGVLAAYLGNLKRITGLMQFDLFHIYTVDAHSLIVVSILRKFFSAKDRAFHPHANEVAKTLAKPFLLYLAGLLHDLGKGTGAEHAVVGAQEAYDFCQLHRLNKEEVNLVTWLVRYHLIMSSTIQKKDLSNPEVIAEFCKDVPHESYVDYLYLLTSADIYGTAPSLLNDFKKALLKQLWLKAKHYLKSNQQDPIRVAKVIQRRKQALNQYLLQQGYQATKINQFWNWWQSDFFLAHHTDELLQVSRFILKNEHQAIAIEGVFNNQFKLYELQIWGQKNKHLFTVITTYLSNFNCSIVKAQIFPTQDQQVFHRLFFQPLQEVAETFDIFALKQQLLSAVETILTDASTPLPKLRQKALDRRRKSLIIKPTVEIVRKQADLLEVHLNCVDQFGLLAMISRQLTGSKVSIVGAFIATVGGRAEDTLLLNTDADSGFDSEKIGALKAEILKLISFRNLTSKLAS